LSKRAVRDKFGFSYSFVVELNHAPISRFVCCVWQTAVALPYGHTEGKKCKH